MLVFFLSIRSLLCVKVVCFVFSIQSLFQRIVCVYYIPLIKNLNCRFHITHDKVQWHGVQGTIYFTIKLIVINGLVIFPSTSAKKYRCCH